MLPEWKTLSTAYVCIDVLCEAISFVVQYKGANIQLLDLPGIIEGAAQGKGRGKQVIATARTSDLVLIMLDATKPETHKSLPGLHPPSFLHSFIPLPFHLARTYNSYASRQTASTACVTNACHPSPVTSRAVPPPLACVPRPRCIWSSHNYMRLMGHLSSRFA